VAPRPAVKAVIGCVPPEGDGTDWHRAVSRPGVRYPVPAESTRPVGPTMCLRWALMTTSRQHRPIEVWRGAWGVALLVVPAQIVRATGARPDRRTLVIARLLGLRQVVQAGVSGLAPSATTLLVGAAVDIAHALTATALGAVDPRRRIALLDGAVAATWGLASVRAASQR